MKKYLIAGNWKMNTNMQEAEKLTFDILEGITEYKENINILLCPPFTNLSALNNIICDSPIELGAQNCHWLDNGAYTGEVSCSMLKSVGCNYVIIGHSERRQYFGETNQSVNLKVKSALVNKLKPLVCIGESLDQRQSGKTFDILHKQIAEGFTGITEAEFGSIVLAYEPVWAIGTGIAATTEQVDEAHNRIREMIVREFGAACKDVLILYGGSVNETNAKGLLRLENVNGALIGGASLKAASFVSIYYQAYSL